MKPAVLAAFAALLALGAITVTRAAESPSSVAALLSRVPDLPGTAEEAARWVDKNGALVHPELLALRKDIEAHQQAVGQIQKPAAVRHQAQSRGLPLQKPAKPHSSAQMMRLNAHLAIWQEADEGASRVLKKPLAVSAAKPLMG